MMLRSNGECPSAYHEPVPHGGWTKGHILWAAPTVVLLTIAMLVAPPLSSGSVSACSCAGLADAEAFAAADAVFSGRLVEVRMPSGPMTSSDDPARYVFEVDTVLKGAVFETQSVVSARDGASCGLELRTGIDAVVFARTESSYDLADGELDSSLCSGSRSGVAPEGMGSPTDPTAGSSAIGSYDDNNVAMIVGVVIVLAAAVLAIAGVVLGRRARRSSSP